MNFVTVQFPSLSCNLPLRCLKYLPQHPILKQPLPTFLPQCDRPSFTPIENKRQNYSSVILTFTFLDRKTG
jgi:hypothetical protein